MTTENRRCETCAFAVKFRTAANDIHSQLDCREGPPHYAIVPILDPVTRNIAAANTQIMPRVVPPDHWCFRWQNADAGLKLVS